MGDQTRLELFNEMFLLVLDQLIINIPHAKDLNPVLIADGMSLDVTEPRRKMAGSFTGGGDEGTGFAPLRNGDRFSNSMPPLSISWTRRAFCDGSLATCPGDLDRLARTRLSR